MALADCLRKVVEDKCQQSPDSGGTVKLKEDNGMSVEVSGLNQDSVVIRAEKINLSGLKLKKERKKGSWPWNKKCDYIIVNPDGDTVRVLFLELKKNLNNNTYKGLEQLRWSLPRLEYLWSLCRILCGDEPDRPEVRYALVAEKGSRRLDKQPIRSRGSPSTIQHEGIEVGLHIVSNYTWFHRLWGN